MFFSLSRESSLRIGRSTKRMGCLRSDDTGTSVLFDTIFGSYISNFQRNRREEIRDLRMMSDEREEKARCFSDGVSKSPRYPGACIIHIFTPNILIIIILIFVRDGPLEEERAHALKRKKKKKNTVRTHESLYTFPVLSRRSARARTPERLLYKTKTYIYIAARVA